MQNKDAIPFKHWSLKVGRTDPATGGVAPYFGVITTGVDDLHQSISTLILTPLGSVPTEPEKGCDLMPYIDRTPDIAIPQMTRAIWDALTIWEPRVVVQDIEFAAIGIAHFNCAIYWRPIQSVLDDLTVTELTLDGSASADRRVA